MLLALIDLAYKSRARYIKWEKILIKKNNELSVIRTRENSKNDQMPQTCKIYEFKVKNRSQKVRTTEFHIKLIGKIS
jgi:hypothetical protein